MCFQNFNNFQFGWDMYKQNFRIFIPIDSSPNQDLKNMGIVSDKKNSGENFKEKSVCEPLLVTQNPSITNTNSDAGQFPNSQLVWESKNKYPIGTKVITADGSKYHVSSISPNRIAGLILYNLTNDKG